jgi:LacI family transcriptional regulator
MIVHNLTSGQFMPASTKNNPPTKSDQPTDASGKSAKLSPKTPQRRVALLIETSREYGRGLLRGINRYQSEHGPWSIYLQPRGIDAPPPAWLKRWHGDGILARIDNRAMADAILASELPAIDLRYGVVDLGLPLVGTDQAAVGQLVANHFAERGLSQFAFCGPHTTNPLHAGDHRREAHFKQAIEARGGSLIRFEGEGQKATWEQQLDQLTQWVAALPKPIGIMAVNDDRGLQVLDACRRAGVLVPDEVAVVGVDNDEILCAMATPPMSSVVLDVERIGYAAAELLDQMMQGGQPTTHHLRLPPLGVVTRQSSDTNAIADREVALAAQWIRRHACEPIGVNQVVRQTTLSRRALEQRYLQALGRTLNDEIIRVKLEHTRRLLLETDLPLSTIADRVGLSSGSYLSTLFHRKQGITCTEFRQRHRRVTR